MEEEFLTPPQCAERKKVSRQAAVDAIKRGDLKATEIPGKIRSKFIIRPADCEAWQPSKSASDRGRQGSEARWNKE